MEIAEGRLTRPKSTGDILLFTSRATEDKMTWSRYHDIICVLVARQSRRGYRAISE